MVFVRTIEIDGKSAQYEVFSEDGRFFEAVLASFCEGPQCPPRKIRFTLDRNEVMAPAEQYGIARILVRDYRLPGTYPGQLPGDHQRHRDR
ncbi:MAG TPA: hypothetical protein VHK69_02050 [Chitinophagaceae bacterium]|jgi:hypothetical protein|nr:hypothetical protein [Chitinophagaceae bacterium]